MRLTSLVVVWATPLGAMGVGFTAYYQTFPELFEFLCQSSGQRIWGFSFSKAK